MAIPGLNMGTGGGDLSAAFGAGGDDSLGNSSKLGGSSSVNNMRLNIATPQTTGAKALDLAAMVFNGQPTSEQTTQKTVLIGGGLLLAAVVVIVVFKGRK